MKPIRRIGKRIKEAHDSYRYGPNSEHYNHLTTYALVSAFIIIFAFAILQTGVGITGYAISNTYQDNLDKTFNTNSVYLWTPTINGKISGAGITGSINGTGTVRTYLVDKEEFYLLNEFQITNQLLAFNSYCEETCSVDLTNKKYIIRTEIEGTIEYKLDSITYSKNTITSGNTTTTNNTEEFVATTTENESTTITLQNTTKAEKLIEIINKTTKLNSTELEEVIKFIDETINKKETIEETTTEETTPTEEPQETTTQEEIITEEETITTTQQQARINKKVKWEQKIKVKQNKNVIVNLPTNAQNIKVNKKDENGAITKAAQKISFGSATKTNKKTKEIELEETISTNEEIITEYETEAPYAEEITTLTGKEITIIGPDEPHYQNVIANTNLPNELTDLRKVKLYWHVNGSQKITDYTANDTNNNGLYDYIEWTVPHLSNQTYSLIIEIVSASHLDSNREFIEDVYDYVKEQDNNWVTIPANDYLRVTFEQELDNTKDITLYARSENGIVEVYEENKTTKITEFTINEEKKYKEYLTNLESTQDTFDLKVIGTAVEFDYVFDPDTIAPNITYDAKVKSDGTAITDDSIIVNVTSVDDSTNISTFIDFDNTLAAWYRMDDYNDSHLFDYNELYNGTLQGEANYTSAGKIGEAFDFDGNGDYIDLGTSLIPTDDDFTLALWFKYDVTTSIDEILTQYTSGADGRFTIAINQNEGGGHQANTLYVYGENGLSMSELSLSASRWYFFTLVRTGTNAEMFLDGVSADTDDGVGSIQDTNTMIGKLGDLTGYEFDGSIDDVMIFNRSLTAGEIKGLYANTSTKDVENNFTSLTEGTYTFKAYSQDLAGNVNSTETRTITIDTTPPNWTNIPGNVTLEYLTESLAADFNATDNVAIDNYTINDTTNFQINSSGYLINITNLQIGTYHVNVSVNDTSGNTNWTTFQTIIQDTTPPQIDFANPTPDNASTISDDFLTINVTITETNLANTTLEWNGTNTTTKVYTEADNYSLTNYEDLDLILSFNFDNSATNGETTTHFYDFSGNNNNGTGGNFDEDEIITGKYGNAVSLTSQNEYITVPHSAELNPTSQRVSIAFWMKATSIVGDRMALSKGTGASRSYNLYENAGIRFKMGTSGTGSFIASTEYLNAWHHFVFIFNGSHTSSYLDNALYGTPQTASWVSNTDPLGLNSYGDGTFVAGAKSFDDLRIYNRTLTATEIDELYTATIIKQDSDSWELTVNKTSLDETDYTFTAYAADTAGNTNNTETRNVTIQSAVTPPNVTNILPTNNTIYEAGDVIEIAANVTSTNAISSVEANITLPNGTQENTTLTNSAGDKYNNTYTLQGIIGQYNITITATDDSSNVNATETATFNVTDTTIPNITINSPTNNTYYNTTEILINITATDSVNISTIWYYNESDNVTYTDATLINVSEENHTFEFYTNDSSNNINTTNITFSVDATFPIINYSTGTQNNNTYFNKNWIYTNITITETNFANITYTLYNTTEIQNQTNYTTQTTQINWTGLTDKNYTYNIQTTDKAGNTNTTENRTITIDTTNPTTEYTTGTEPNGAYKNQTWIYTNITITETNFANITYTLYNTTEIQNQTNYTTQTTQINWTGLTEGTYWYNITTTDKANNTNTTETRNITLDITTPIINLTYPTNGSRANASSLNRTINWTITETNQDTCLLSTNGAANESVTCTDLTTNITIIKQAWNNLTLWVNDSAGNTAESNLTFLTNIIPPTPNLTLTNNSIHLIRWLNLSWTNQTDDDNDTLQYTVVVASDEDFTNNLTIDTTNNTNYQNYTYPDGTIYWKVQSYDGFEYGNYSETYQVNLVNATINISSPAANTVVYPGSTQTITIQETNRTDWISNVTLTILNTDTNSTYQTTNSGNNWTYDLFVPLLTARTLTLVASAYNDSNEHVNSTSTLYLTNVGTSYNPLIQELYTHPTYQKNNEFINITLIINASTHQQTQTLNVTYPNGTTEAIDSISNLTDDLTRHYNYTLNATQNGTYTILTEFTDVNGASVNKTIYAYGVNNETITITNTGQQRIEIDDLSSNKKLYNGTDNVSTNIPQGTYNIRVIGNPLNLTIYNASINESGEFYYNDITNTITPPTNKLVINEFEINTTYNFTEFLGTYNYTDDVFSITDEDNLEVHHCTNRTNSTECTWEELTSTVNTDENIITFTAYNMSPFLVAESTATSTTTTTSTSVISSGGTTEVETIKIVSMDLIAPRKLTIYHDDTVSTPILLENTGDYDLTNLKIKAESNTHFLTPTLDTNKISILDSGDSKSIILLVRADSDPGEYEIIITAESEDPKIKETTKIYMDLSDKYGQDKEGTTSQLNFAEKLFEDNPECLELKELLEQAGDEIQANRFHKAQTLIKSATDACRSLIKVRNKVKERKAKTKEITIGLAWLNQLKDYKKNENIVIYSIILIILITIISMSFRKKKGKKIKNKKTTKPTRKRKQPQINKREQYYS